MSIMLEYGKLTGKLKYEKWETETLTGKIIYEKRKTEIISNQKLNTPIC